MKRRFIPDGAVSDVCSLIAESAKLLRYASFDWRSKRSGWACENRDGHMPTDPVDTVEEAEQKMGGHASCRYCGDDIVQELPPGKRA